MKRLFLTLTAIFIIVALQAQDQSETIMYESIYLSPKLDALSTLNKNMTAHNKKYHGEGKHQAFVQTVVTGRRSGDLVWLMGPGTFANLDSRPAEGGHDEDWANNVMSNLEEVSRSEYWELDQQASYTPENSTNSKMVIRFRRTKNGERAAVAKHYAKLTDLFREKKYSNGLSVYISKFPTGNGRNMASVFTFANWAEMDENLPVGKDFDEKYGAGSWAKWSQDMAELTEWVDMEVRENLPAMSGMAEE